MANGFVKVFLLGNLGATPEVKATNGGNSVANLRVAATERVKNKAGEYEDKTEWMNVVVFGKDAEFAGRYLEKGRQVYVEGRLTTREWTDKEGNKKTSTEIVAREIRPIGSGKKAETNTDVEATGDTSSPF